MAIESAGEQRYYDFIADSLKKHRRMKITWISFVIVGCISFTTGAEASVFIGIILCIQGFALAAKNFGDKKALASKLNVIDDKKTFFDQLVARDTVEFKDLGLLITNDYLLKYSDDLYIYKFADMKNVRFKNNRLYLVDANRKEYEIAVNEVGKENSFDTACQLIAILI